MNLFNSLENLWKKTKHKISEIFNSNELWRMAREVKFIQRSSSILRAIDFVELFTTASIDSEATSLNTLCSDLRELNLEASLTPQSLMERINKPESAEFLKVVFETALKKGLTNIVENIPPELFQSFNNVWIEDCTECVLNEHLVEHFKGSSGVTSKSSVKLDVIYELMQKNIFSVELVDRRSPDQKIAQNHIDLIQKNDLWIRDLGFFDATVFLTMMSVGAFFLSRLPACVYVYLNDKDEKPVDIAAYINKKFPLDSVIDIDVFVTTSKLRVRLIAYRAPKELADKRRREANKSAQKKGQQKTEASLGRLDFSFFITNVPKEIWKPEVVGTIYTVRWQIELIFKSWKSQLQINYLKGVNPNRIKCLLYGKLILIVSINIIYKLCCCYAQKLGREISLCKLINWLKRDSRLVLIIFGRLNMKLFGSLIREVPLTLCKDKRKRMTTQKAIENHTSFPDLYANFCRQLIEYESVGVA